MKKNIEIFASYKHYYKLVTRYKYSGNPLERVIGETEMEHRRCSRDVERKNVH